MLGTANALINEEGHESLKQDNHKINDFVIRFANVNGTGSASANALTTQGRVSHGRATCGDVGAGLVKLYWS